MAAHDLGIDVPGALSVAGVDDSAIAQIVWPRLTTIHQPVFDMARDATAMLVAMLEKKEHEDLIEHPVALITRQSTGPAPPLQAS
ncbi:Transcriptional regulator, LacI family [hydrothermal vent metagenome]|uniref:Transcriptional regulator, LacI family n=1 Tax=hydrothermal vent metagenome TaxID=652676 RepID=A0A160TPR3_9ZZZZ